MIIEVQKVLIFGSKQDLDGFFQKAQKAAILEFIGASRKKIDNSELQKLILAIRLLKKRQVLLKPKSQSSLSPLALAEKVIEASTLLETLTEEERVVTAEISRVQVFGDFSKEDCHFIEEKGNRVLQFFAMKSDKAKDFKLPFEMVYVGTDYDLDYFIAILKERKKYPGMIEIHIEKPLGMLKMELASLQEKKAKIENELRSLTAYLPFLQESFSIKLNAYHRENAQQNILEPMPSLFAVEAWIPANKLVELKSLLHSFTLFYETIKKEAGDKVPTYMENNKAARIGEDLVQIYDTPSQKDRDPSPWVFWFFAVFFAMIVSDAGYGVLYLFLALFFKWRFPHLEGIQKRMVNLALNLSIFCIGWGVLTTSFFGLDFSLDNPLRKVSLTDFLIEKKAEYHVAKRDEVYQNWEKKYPEAQSANSGKEFLQNIQRKNPAGKVTFEAYQEFNDNILMEIALLLGVIHLTLAFLRSWKKNWAGLGWIVFMLGGYLFFPSFLQATSLFHFLGVFTKEQGNLYGPYLLYGGTCLAVILALWQQKLKGLAEIFNVIQVFSDVLSYLRLYALALAGMIVASTFNEIGSKFGFLGIFIIIAGHATNIILGIMGGVIHGLRLNFLEWYRYCFEGGGRKFNPLQFIQVK